MIGLFDGEQKIGALGIVCFMIEMVLMRMQIHLKIFPFLFRNASLFQNFTLKINTYIALVRIGYSET